MTSLVYRVDPAAPDTFADAIEAAARALLAGELVVFPTETVYGIAARPDDAGATARLFAAKRRPGDLNLPVLAPGAGTAWGIGQPVGPAGVLAGHFWPGPLTLVLPRTARARAWSLGDRTESVAVRVPDHPLTMALLAATGPIAATSANRSGDPPLAGETALVETFGSDVSVYVVLEQGARRPGGAASTVVDLTVDPPVVLRRGPVRAADLARAIGTSPGASH